MQGTWACTQVTRDMVGLEKRGRGGGTGRGKQVSSIVGLGSYNSFWRSGREREDKYICCESG